MIVALAALALVVGKGALHALETIRGLFQQGLHVGRHRGIALKSATRGQASHAGQPFLEFTVETVLGVSRLQVEKADDQRTAETKQRGRKAGGHAAQGNLDVFLERGEHGHRVGADTEGADDIGDGANGDEQAPEGTQQPQEDGKANQITRQVPGLLEAQLHTVENGLHRGRRQSRLPLFAAGQHARHRRKHARLAFRFSLGGLPKSLDPVDFMSQTEHLPEIGQYSRSQDEQDDAIEERVGDEDILQPMANQHSQHGYQKQKCQHPKQYASGLGHGELS